MQSITDNITQINANIAVSCQRSGITNIEIVAVSKRQHSSKIIEALDAGLHVFGENQVQELEKKYKELINYEQQVNWRFIGHLQKNKVRKVLPFVTSIDTINSTSLAQRVDRIAGELGLIVDILLQVNISEDTAKSGFTRMELEHELEHLLALKNTSIKGLMTITKKFETSDETRREYAKMYSYREQLEKTHALPILSMGMSNDYQIAIEEGSNQIRLGSCLFGPRES